MVYAVKTTLILPGEQVPTIYDNSASDYFLLNGLRQALAVSRRADFCVGYFNLRGWREIADDIEKLPGQDSRICRLLIGMLLSPKEAVQQQYGVREAPEITNAEVHKNKKNAINNFRRQLTFGIPTAADEQGLRRLSKQLREGKLRVKYYARYPLHAKLYLAHRDDVINPTIGFVGSSNLTLAGLARQRELNIDVLDKDAATKLARWFEERWDDHWAVDITESLVEVLEESWAGVARPPYHLYLKTAYHLSREAIAGIGQFRVPPKFANEILDFQSHAVAIAAQYLNRRGGVIIGDVVGLGKTMVASAVAKTFQEDHGDNVLVICPPKLKSMWEGYIHKYSIAGSVLSHGALHKLKNMARYKLVVVDESHNFRNRGSQRYAMLKDYLRINESRVILMTATPYNKDFGDMASQLLLFLEPDCDLGIRPDHLLHHTSGGERSFRAAHPNTLVSSLSAFEQSDFVDDWRELMRHYMVRRTRAHIQRNYAQYDEEKGRHYFTFNNSQKFYFPKRQARRLDFAMPADDSDVYTKLYSERIVESISGMALPRYGLQQYISPHPPVEATQSEQGVIANLTRAGPRLRGFARINLFKRLESSGHAFLLSVRRHILRNAIYLAALQEDAGDAEDEKAKGGKPRASDLPIGQMFVERTDDAAEEEDDDQESNIEYSALTTMDEFLRVGKNMHKILRSKRERGKFHWIRGGLFTDKLRQDLYADCQRLLDILAVVPMWKTSDDHKLAALHELCTKTHGSDKILIFSQFKDTVMYLHGALSMAKGGIAMVHGGSEDIVNIIQRFSPRSNPPPSGEPAKLQPLRIIVATDALSEGQNLQDAHVIVNYDLPWGIIRLVQRAGRVDRIGQQAETIECYSAMPAEGVENIISLRSRLMSRMKENEEVIGSDEQFFGEDSNADNHLRAIYDGRANLEDEEDETDLISRAYDIWRQAIKDNKELEQTILQMPDVVYSAKQSTHQGAVAYVKNNLRDMLVEMDTQGGVVSHSQSRILDLLECKPDEPTAPAAANHHELVTAATLHVAHDDQKIGGQLGGENSIRNKLFNRLQNISQQDDGTLFADGEVGKVAQQVYDHPLTERARERIGRQMRLGIEDKNLADMAVNLWRDDELCALPKDDEPAETRIICSMGLVKK